MFYAQHVACYDSKSVERPILSDDFFLIRCRMQMRSTRKAMEYIINFLIPLTKKQEIVPRRVHVVLTDIFPKGGFLHRQTNERDISSFQIYLFMLYDYVPVIIQYGCD